MRARSCALCVTGLVARGMQGHPHAVRVRNVSVQLTVARWFEAEHRRVNNGARAHSVADAESSSTRWQTVDCVTGEFMSCWASRWRPVMPRAR